jgi:hypothetical protein
MSGMKTTDLTADFERFRRDGDTAALARVFDSRPSAKRA